MPVFTAHALGASRITVSDGAQLSGFTQGDGSHLQGKTITLADAGWETVEIADSEGRFEDSDRSQSLDAAQSFDGAAYRGGERVEAEFELRLEGPDGTGYTALAVNINEGGAHASYGTVEGLAFVGEIPPAGVPLTVVSTGEGPSHAYDALAAPLCFAAGARIATPGSPVAVERLAPGDLVVTMDRGARPVRWIGTRRLDRADLARRPGWRPVRIAAGALGPGLPEADLLVSRQHRVLVGSAIVARMFGVPDVLVPAIKLTALDGVEIAHDMRAVTYCHMLFDTHEIVWANGLPTESLFTGPEALKGVTPAARAELVSLFPDLAGPVPRPGPARPLVEAGPATQRLVARHVKNRKPMVTRAAPGPPRTSSA